jgi:membrane-associated protease RseP (regulator of RpoE activity)
VDATKSANPRYVAILAFVAAVILIAGWLARPREIPAAPPPVPSETELQQLARRAQRRELETTADYFAALAKDAASSLVTIAVTQTTGVIWDKGRVLAASASQSGGPADAATAHGLPFLMIDNPEARVSVRRAETMPKPGAWVVAVWQIGERHTFLAASFGQVASTTCAEMQVSEVVTNASFSRGAIGGGLFDLDGGLLAVLLPCEGRVAAITPVGIDAMRRVAESQTQQFFRRHGLLLAEIPAAVAAYFTDADGLVVTEIWNGSAADRAGFYAGDIVTAINGVTVVQLSQLETLPGLSNTSIETEIRRGARRVDLALSPQLDVADSAVVDGIQWEPARRGFAIQSVEPGSRASRAGLQSGDRVLRIDYSAPSRVAQIERALALAHRPATLLEIERGQRRVAVFLQ